MKAITFNTNYTYDLLVNYKENNSQANCQENWLWKFRLSQIILELYIPIHAKGVVVRVCDLSLLASAKQTKKKKP